MISSKCICLFRLVEDIKFEKKKKTHRKEKGKVRQKTDRNIDR